MRQFRRVVLPVLAIKGFHCHFRHRSGFQAPGIYINPIRITTRYIKTFDAADFTENMFGNAGIESVLGQKFMTASQAKRRARHDQMEKSAQAAY